MQSPGDSDEAFHHGFGSSGVGRYGRPPKVAGAPREAPRNPSAASTRLESQLRKLHGKELQTWQILEGYSMSKAMAILLDTGVELCLGLLAATK